MSYINDHVFTTTLDILVEFAYDNSLPVWSYTFAISQVNQMIGMLVLDSVENYRQPFWNQEQHENLHLLTKYALRELSKNIKVTKVCIEKPNL